MQWDSDQEVERILEIRARFRMDRIRCLHNEFGFEQTGGELAQNNLPRAIVADTVSRTTTTLSYCAVWASACNFGME